MKNPQLHKVRVLPLLLSLWYSKHMLYHTSFDVSYRPVLALKADGGHLHRRPSRTFFRTTASLCFSSLAPYSRVMVRSVLFFLSRSKVSFLSRNSLRYRL